MLASRQPDCLPFHVFLLVPQNFMFSVLCKQYILQIEISETQKCSFKTGQIGYEMFGVTESLAERAIQIAGSNRPI